VTREYERLADMAAIYLKATEMVRQREDQLLTAIEAAAWASAWLEESAVAAQMSGPSDPEELDFEVLHELIAEELDRVVRLGQILAARDPEPPATVIEIEDGRVLTSSYLYRSVFQETAVWVGLAIASGVLGNRADAAVLRLVRRGPRESGSEPMTQDYAVALAKAATAVRLRRVGRPVDDLDVLVVPTAELSPRGEWTLKVVADGLEAVVMIPADAPEHRNVDVWLSFAAEGLPEIGSTPRRARAAGQDDSHVVLGRSAD
jgi:hypothetical protein